MFPIMQNQKSRINNQECIILRKIKKKKSTIKNANSYGSSIMYFITARQNSTYRKCYLYNTFIIYNCIKQNVTI